MKAVREALDKVSLPTLLVDVPGGVANARVKAKIGVPKHVRLLPRISLPVTTPLRPVCPCEGSCLDTLGAAQMHGIT